MRWRVARPGGLVAVRDADHAAIRWYPADPALDRWRSTYRSVARSFGAEPDAGRRLLGWAQDAGLTDVVLSGSVRLEVAGERTPVSPGTVAYVPAGVPHRFVDIHGDLRVVVVLAPPGS